MLLLRLGRPVGILMHCWSIERKQSKQIFSTKAIFVQEKRHTRQMNAE